MNSLKVFLSFFIFILSSCSAIPEEPVLIPGQVNVQDGNVLHAGTDTLYHPAISPPPPDSIDMPVPGSPTMLNYGKDVKLP